MFTKLPFSLQQPADQPTLADQSRDFIDEAIIRLHLLRDYANNSEQQAAQSIIERAMLDRDEPTVRVLLEGAEVDPNA
ncbi:hypothetical protein PG993_005021 [Apiospora rasikravindrae]|uniref:Uncharacterized protein n=1 Tax=Apiospora rasikravindrae TaxID=990691 RepID=A0ABR1TEH1_9PEZI